MFGAREGSCVVGGSAPISSHAAPQTHQTCAASVHPCAANASPRLVRAAESPAVRFETIMPTVSCHLASVEDGSGCRSCLVGECGADAAPLSNDAPLRRAGVPGPKA